MCIWIRASRWRKSSSIIASPQGEAISNIVAGIAHLHQHASAGVVAIASCNDTVNSMPQSDQGVNNDRYTVVPRTAIFLRRGESYLLLKGAPTKRLWANKYNGLGGHVERGEDVLSAAKRELLEESGLRADLWLCGALIVDAGEIGIALYIFSGENSEGEPKPSKEGLTEWIRYDAINELPVVEDLPVLLAKVHSMERGDTPFSARSYYDEAGKLVVEFGE